ncbi:hypothetical protein NC99_37680 [Sunxiuqinia dokdonensis]|uniref:Uncharacterized protein n=1 Tax=Sunxiuqinia dokdonensis TaxID=1409788 RepID=A0A0L8V4I0_9BACT|nr:hypothetical protein NC99_37680 [Sunxiuqinia dokdonensis]
MFIGVTRTKLQFGVLFPKKVFFGHIKLRNGIQFLQRPPNAGGVSAGSSHEKASVCRVGKSRLTDIWIFGSGKSRRQPPVDLPARVAQNMGSVQQHVRQRALVVLQVVRGRLIARLPNCCAIIFNMKDTGPAFAILKPQTCEPDFGQPVFIGQSTQHSHQHILFAQSPVLQGGVAHLVLVGIDKTLVFAIHHIIVILVFRFV